MGVLGQGVRPRRFARAVSTSVIERLGYIDYDEHLRVFRKTRTRCSSLVLSRGEKSRGWIPSKFFQYLGTGNRDPGHGSGGRSARDHRRDGAGVCVDPDDVPGASRAFEALYDAWQAGTPARTRDAGAVARNTRGVT